MIICVLISSPVINNEFTFPANLPLIGSQVLSYGKYPNGCGENYLIAFSLEKYIHYHAQIMT